MVITRSTIIRLKYLQIKLVQKKISANCVVNNNSQIMAQESIKKCLTMKTVNKNVCNMEYAILGPILTRARELEEELARVSNSKNNVHSNVKSETPVAFPTVATLSLARVDRPMVAGYLFLRVLGSILEFRDCVFLRS